MTMQNQKARMKVSGRAAFIEFERFPDFLVVKELCDCKECFGGTNV